jgi:predicted NAD-dependent protein-ADP-ribosyltransferase YbiA (DUF1768 family)
MNFLCKAGCPHPSWNNKPNEHCCRTCYRGEICIHAAKCISGCGKPTFNRKQGEYCSLRCKASNTSDNYNHFLAFYYPGHETAWDKEYGCSFCGNFYLSPIELKPPNSKEIRKFLTAESAFQALKFWGNAAEFESLSGAQAYREKMKRKGTEDWTYSGYDNNWLAMLAVLRAKFEQNSDLAFKLINTKKAFLLEHNIRSGIDMYWSDNNDGEGFNALGAQLMIIRDELQHNTDSWIYTEIDKLDGSIISGSQWQYRVRNACKIIKQIFP